MRLSSKTPNGLQLLPTVPEQPNYLDILVVKPKTKTEQREKEKKPTKMTKNQRRFMNQSRENTVFNHVDILIP